MVPDGYRYYSTKKCPYINGGMRGIVTVRGDQLDPQPRATSSRPALPPLRGAKIIGFDRVDEKKTITVNYDLKGKTHSVKYTANAESYTFVFTDGTGKESTETYRIRPDGRRPSPSKEENRPLLKRDDPPVKARDGFKLANPAFEAGSKIPSEYTGDGDGVSPPLQWKGAPAGTNFFALQLWHKPNSDGDAVKSYWVTTNIAAQVTSLEKNAKGVGKMDTTTSGEPVTIR